MNGRFVSPETERLVTCASVSFCPVLNTDQYSCKHRAHSRDLAGHLKSWRTPVYSSTNLLHHGKQGKKISQLLRNRMQMVVLPSRQGGSVYISKLFSSVAIERA